MQLKSIINKMLKLLNDIKHIVRFESYLYTNTVQSFISKYKKGKFYESMIALIDNSQGEHKRYTYIQH